MAEPGDHDDHDDQIGFASAAALAGRMREPVAAAQAPAPASSQSQVQAQPLPAWAVETPMPARPSLRSSFGRRDGEPVTMPEGAVGLFAVYVLILFAVPTFGVSALLALAAVLRRDPPEQDLAASHFIYQKRTLIAAAIAAVAGVLLIVINLGVFVLFVMAVWVMARGAVGVFRLKAGHAIPKPMGWWI